MGDLLLVDFASRSKAYTKQPETLPTCHDDLVGNSVLHTVYESSLGFVEPVEPVYVAPESDGA